MPIIFACACAHAPGITAWPDAAPADQRERFHGAYHELGRALRSAAPEAIVAFTTEHWANFFLNNYPAFCIGRAEHHKGPFEDFLNIAEARVPGDSALANALIQDCFANGFEVSVSDELVLDHGTMVPLSFLTPAMEIPVVPVMINALAPPLPSPARCWELGEQIGRTLAAQDKRVAVVATGGLSHRPGEPRAGEIDSEFDRAFLAALGARDDDRLLNYTSESIAPAGFGAQEVRMWIALAGAVPGWPARVLSYEPVRAWSTGAALADFAPPAR